MAKKKPIEQFEYKDNKERLAMLKKTAREFNKSIGVEVLSFAQDIIDAPRASFGFKEVDEFFGGGVPHGNFVTLWGSPGCLAENTKIPFYSKTKSGNFKGKKNQSIKRLYHIFNNIAQKGSGKYIRKESLKVDYYTPSIDENKNIFLNKINNVVFSGKKLVYELETFHKEKIYATEDHRFLTPEGYKKLKDLNPGDVLYYNPKKPQKTDRKKRIGYSETTVKYHPYGIKKVINNKTYYRIKRSHLVIEANLNNLSVYQYRKILNTEAKKNIDKLVFINKKTHEVHHNDRNRRNDTIDNLELLTKKEHYNIHKNDSISHIKIKVQETTIKSICTCKKVDTYDIEMSRECPNFIAEGLVVHNSGKSTLAHMLTAQAQKEGKIVYYIALEPYDKDRAKHFGVDLDSLVIGQFPQAEQSLDTIIDFARKKLVDVIILDSIHSLAPKGMQEDKKGTKSVGDDTMALLARKLSDFFKIAIDPIKRAGIACLLIGQTRTNLGGFIAIEALTGGNALHHYSKGIVKIRRGQKANAPSEKVWTGSLTKSGNKSYETKLIGFESVMKCDKCQISDMVCEGTELRMSYYFESGFSLPENILKEIEEEEKEIQAQDVEEIKEESEVTKEKPKKKPVKTKKKNR